MHNKGVIADAVKYMQSLWHCNNQLFIAGRTRFAGGRIYKWSYTVDMNIWWTPQNCSRCEMQETKDHQQSDICCHDDMPPWLHRNSAALSVFGVGRNLCFIAILGYCSIDYKILNHDYIAKHKSPHGGANTLTRWVFISLPNSRLIVDAISWLSARWVDNHRYLVCWCHC